MRSIYKWGVVCMLGFLINSVLADPAEEYPRLSANQSTSQDYEIVKLIDGPIDALYQFNNQSLFIAQSNHDLWKINAAGEVIDHFNSSNLYSSGLILEEDGFIDWVFTGDKHLKSLSAPVDASNYSEQGLFNVFDQAEIIEFLDKNEKGFAYLYKNGNMEVLDITRWREKIINLVYMSRNIKTAYNLHHDETEINGNRFDDYTKKPDLFSIINDTNSFPSYLTIKGYKKITFHRPQSVFTTLLENILGPIVANNYPKKEFGYDVGYSFIELMIGGEKLKFSVLSDGRFSSERSHNFSWLDPNPTGVETLKFIAINYRRNNLAELNEMSLLPYYESDIGLYVARKKIPHNRSEKNAWQVTYSGMHSNEPIVGHINFFNPELGAAYYWFYQRRPISPGSSGRRYFWPGRHADMASPMLKTLPKSLVFNWGSFEERRFRLVVNSREAWFYSPDGPLVGLTLVFDPAELEYAFQQVSNTNKLVQLNLNMIEQPYGAELIVSVKGGGKEIRLNKFSFDYQAQPYTPKSPHTSPDKYVVSLFSAYEKSMQELKPDAFLKVLDEFIATGKVSSYAPAISYYFAELGLRFNIAGRSIENAELMNFYFDKIHSLIGYSRTDELQHQNLTVFATQVIHLALTTQNSELTEKLISRFVDKDFDLEKETNRSFLFNVACYYALVQNKPRMLDVIRRTIILGRAPESYLSEKDFTEYWQDADFLEALKPVAVTAP